MTYMGVAEKCGKQVKLENREDLIKLANYCNDVIR
jgi:hypothetical protein